MTLPTPETLEQVRELLARGLAPETVAARLGIDREYLDAGHVVWKIPKRKQGRPSSPDRCPTCGAAPANQRKVAT